MTKEEEENLGLLAPRVSVEHMQKSAQTLVKNYSLFVKHAPKLLRESMMLAYQTAIDDMFKAMDKNKLKNQVVHEERSSVVLLDQNGHAT